MVVAIVGTHSWTASGFRGLSSEVAAVVVGVFFEPSSGGDEANISGGGGGCAHWSATGFSPALIRLGSKVFWASTNRSS